MRAAGQTSGLLEYQGIWREDPLEFNPNIYLTTEVPVNHLSPESISCFSKTAPQPLDNHAFHLSEKDLKCRGSTSTSSHAATMLWSSHTAVPASAHKQGYVCILQHGKL